MHLPSQPVVLEVQRGVQVVQDDSAGAYDDPAFQRMLEAYGGLAAQIVTPVMRDGRLEAILSLHQLGAPRAWTAVEVAAATARVASDGSSCEDPVDRRAQPLAPRPRAGRPGGAG